MDDILDDDLFGDDNSTQKELPVGDVMQKDTNEGSDQYQKKKKSNKGIDLFTENPEPKAIDFDKMKVTKTFTIAFARSDMTINENELKIIKKILEKLKDNNFRIRVQCNTALPIWDTLQEVFDNDDITVIKPWPKFCAIEDFRIWIPKDIHKEAAAYHFKNFDNLPTAIKFINSALLTTLFGPTLNESLEFVLVFDPYSSKDKIDFEKVKDGGSFIWFPRSLRDNGMPVYNMAWTDDIKTLLGLLNK